MCVSLGMGPRALCKLDNHSASGVILSLLDPSGLSSECGPGITIIGRTSDYGVSTVAPLLRGSHLMGFFETREFVVLIVKIISGLLKFECHKTSIWKSPLYTAYPSPHSHPCILVTFLTIFWFGILLSHLKMLGLYSSVRNVMHF